MLGLAGVPAAVQFICFIFMPESARWLVGKGRINQAGEVLKKIRGTQNIDHELEEIRSSFAEAACSSEEKGSLILIIILDLSLISIIIQDRGQL
jgi:SP family myo-inositol transporter-like MFS transporter 13